MWDCIAHLQYVHGQQNRLVKFRWRVSSEATHDYLTISAAGTQILANTGGPTEQTGTLTATLTIGQTLVFTYRKDGSVNNGQDRAEISEVKYGAGTADPSTVIYENNVENYFTITNSTYGFYPGIPIPSVTVDTKGRITKGQTIYISSELNARHSNGTIKEGVNTTANEMNAHAEGENTTASGYCSHAEGYRTTASGYCSHAEGDNTIASNLCSYASGQGTIADVINQMVIGKYNKQSNNAYDDAFVIGNGISSGRSNCFRITGMNGVYSNSTYKSSGADYAEFFQWLDDNSNNEDRVGLFVTLVGERIRIAKPTDKHILGIISGCPSILGDVYDDQWKGMYEIDIYGRPVLEEVEVPAETMEIPDPDNPEQTITKVICETHKEIRQKLNPDYDNTQKYIPRSERPEWDAVGMLGKLVAIDDGTCEVDGYCTVGEGGIATKSEQETKFYVMKRLDKNHIKVMLW